MGYLRFVHIIMPSGIPQVTLILRRAYGALRSHERLHFYLNNSFGKNLDNWNLCKRHLLIVDCFCMYRRNGASIDHLLLHCSITANIWFFFFFVWDSFGDAKICDSFPRMLARTFRHKVAKVWQVIPLCILWTLGTKFVGGNLMALSNQLL